MASAKKPKAETAKPKANKAALTPKQEAFAQAYVETSNASEAYRRAYPASRKWKPETLHPQASKLLADPKVATRVAEIQAGHAERHEITVDSITEMLKTVFNGAAESEQWSAASSAALGIAKLHGLIIEKKHVTGDHKHNHAVEPLSDSVAWLTGLLGRTPARAVAQSLPH